MLRVLLAPEEDGPAARYPGLRIVARIPRLPMDPPIHSGSRSNRQGDAAPRLQWRHRVGLAPTSLGAGQRRGLRLVVELFFWSG